MSFSILKILKKKAHLIYNIYFKAALMCFVSYLLFNSVRFLSNSNTSQPFNPNPLYAWWKDTHLFMIFIFIYIFIVNPLNVYIYSYCHKETMSVGCPFLFWKKAVCCSFVQLVTIGFGALMFIIPGYYISYRLRFLPLFVVNHYTQLNSFQIIKLCWQEGTLYALSDILIIDIIFGIIHYCLYNFEYIWIAFSSLQYCIFTILYSHKVPTNNEPDI